ncbi:MAG TPA: N-acetylmuramoyl-L-alanine amidase [Acidobacteriota bacterium]|nr:N-acetylmuramoyl-L-alanine amidase [Acidobacteriota bacterium]HNT18422.1 N-acetylmuramoyl-L-alanine amidase [Acidobacteriota bacterium]HPA27050.1 N-acetylmuramoyl-L-alanine amidase [Acidobacteriota bacterium]HQO20629.1 N-acetylmuramoyl-L-alanine amidase [Acidobacteriota bacterium]HQQ47465.1 N-acetylmuramoyl-L-alanine amidase [Acidobacteriota bacterium]
MRAFVKMAFVACALFLFMAAHLHASVKLPSGKGFLETREHKGQEVFSLADLVRAMGGSAGKDPVSQYPVWETNGHRVVLSTNTPMASVDGKIISLKSTPVEIGGDILLGTDFIGAVLPKIGFRLDEEISPGNGDHKNAQTRQPAPDGKVTVEKTVAYDLIRITFNGSMASLAEAKKEEGKIRVRLPRGKAEMSAENLGEGIATSISVQDGGREVVISLDKGFRSFETVSLKNPERLVLMIKGEGQKPPKEGAAPPSADRELPPIRQAYPAKKPGKTLIVLDPGHGAQDTGALGKEGTVEKELVLDLCLRIKESLEKENIDVLLTRNSDVLVPLRERAAFANFNKADLFISVHFNSSPLKSVRGSESYIMSREATDIWSKELAEKENLSPGSEESGDGLSLILWNLAQNQYIVESTSIAGELQQSLNELFGTKDRGVRQAPFAVLEGARMPAVLLEVAYISNQQEAKDIQNREFSDKVINAIVAPLARFRDRNAPPPAP